MAENIYYCDGCGGVLEWDPVSQQLRCPNCGNGKVLLNQQERIEEHTLTLDVKRMVTAQVKESQTMECQGCGAHIEFSGNETAAKCPYCGSSYVLAKRQEDVITPDGVIPFKLDENGVRDCFRRWIKGRWLAPNALKHLYQGEGFTGVYVPYWTFDAECDCPYEAEGGRRRTERYKDKDGNVHTRTHVDWYPAHGHIRHFFDDIQMAASVRFRQGLLSGLEPYNFKELKSYTPEYISGYLSENYSIGLEDGHKRARCRMENQLEDMAKSEVLSHFDEVRLVHLHPRFFSETYKYVLVPVYSTTYHFKGKSYAVVINGQNGVVEGEYPKSPVKIAFLVLLVFAIVGIIFYLAAGQKTGADTSYQDNRYDSAYIAEWEEDIYTSSSYQLQYENQQLRMEYEDVIITID